MLWYVAKVWNGVEMCCSAVNWCKGWPQQILFCTMSAVPGTILHERSVDASARFSSCMVQLCDAVYHKFS